MLPARPDAARARAPDGVRRVFDAWSKSGRAEGMEREHSGAVAKFLAAQRLPRSFRFLDVGCGNGWLVRRIAALGACTRAVGIDKSAGMIRAARSRGASAKVSYVRTGVESWRTRSRFDVIFSMESLYYADSVEAALESIHGLAAPGGRLYCGTDFYAENRATRWWAGEMKVTMHLMSESEWLGAFRAAGFAARARRVRDPSSSRKWKREAGTLFITGVRRA